MLGDILAGRLVCPLDHSPLVEADAGLVARLNERIAQGGLRNHSGRIVLEKLEGALIRADNEIVYPIRDGIPVVLVDEGIALSQFPAGV